MSHLLAFLLVIGLCAAQVVAVAFIAKRFTSAWQGVGVQLIVGVIFTVLYGVVIKAML